ncbi:hypothetical protein GTW52_10270 [Streptomyces sp. SID8358]|uniref:DUF6304 family protein n=1 Tax=Streptomyces sp. SID8358 TaxID=2690342 RepID=UPI000DACE0F5|nr:DUF6304 family protein [Streptomyces sp. SID8358]MYU33489.1 hypothetical protein [Streptomyces sp. SID8358]
MTDESWAGWYRDRRGSEAFILTTDGRRLRVRVRGTDFEGESFDALLPAAGVVPEAGAFDLADGVLGDCVLEWDLPLPVLAAGTVRQATLSCLLSLRRADPDLYLALHLDGAVYESHRAENDFASALATIRAVLPPDIQLQICTACALSGYLPASGRGISGGLGCFRDAKDAYRDVTEGSAVAGLWDRRTGLVQEIWSCREFEPRPFEPGLVTGAPAERRTGAPGPTEGAGAGRLGVHPLEHA